MNNPYKHPFAENIPAEKHYTGAFIAHLEHLGYVDIELAPECKFTDWDIKAHTKTGRTVTFETKSDLQFHRSGNIIIEVATKCPKTGEVYASGLPTSKADYQVFLLPDNNQLECVVWKTETIMKWLIDRKQYPIWMGNGDRSLAHMASLYLAFSKHQPMLWEVMQCDQPGAYIR